MTPINDQAGRYHSPRGVNAFASINEAIVALGGVPVEAPTFERFARSPGGVQLLEALETLEALAGVDSPVVEEGKFFRSPRPSETFDRLNSVIVGLGGAPIDYGSGVSGAEVVAALEELTTGAEGGGSVDLSEIELAQAAVVPPFIGSFSNLGRQSIIPLTITRPNNIKAAVAGTVLGAAVDARIQIPNVNRVVGGQVSLDMARWRMTPSVSVAFNGLQLWFFDGQPATVLNDGDAFALSDADVAKLIDIYLFGMGSTQPSANASVNQASVAGLSSQLVSGRDVWAYMVAGGAWNVPANFEVQMKLYARWLS